MFVCSGVVAEKTDSQLFFFDKSAITSAAVSSEGECTGRYCRILFIFLLLLQRLTCLMQMSTNVGL